MQSDPEKVDSPMVSPLPTASTIPSSPPPAPQGPQFSKLHEIAFVIIICLAQFISLCGLAQTVAPWMIIGNSFGVQDPGTISWFTASYSLAVGTLILPAGRLGDMFGHKSIFMIGWAWFACWTLVTGFSSGYGHVFFSVCRALQGAGPALLVPNAMALIGRTYPPGMKRALVFSCFGAMGPTGFYFGALLSSTTAQYASWPWSFRILAIVQFFILMASYFIIPARPGAPRKTCATRPRTPTPAAAPPRPKFDFLGAITGIIALVLINIALNQAPISGWNEAYIWETLIMGFAFLGFFLFIEIKYATQPLVPVKGLKKEAAFVLACIVTGWGAHGIWVYYLFLLNENLRGLSAVMATAQLTPVAVTGVVFALSTGYLLKKVGPAWVMFLAMMFFTIGALFVATVQVEQTYWANTFLSVVIMPGGMNLSFPAAMILLSNAMPPEHQGIAASLVATMVNYSISCGLGLAATVDVHVSKKGQDVLGGYHGAWWLGTGITALGWLISAWFVWKSRSKK